MLSCKTIVVVGGGLAGLYTAKLLLQNGYSVKLYEKRKFLGGRVFSINKIVDGHEIAIDSGQHVITGACTMCKNLFREYGLRTTNIDFIPFRVGGKTSHFKLYKTKPTIIGLLLTFITYPHIKPMSRIKLLTCFVKIYRLDPSERNLSEISAESFLVEEMKQDNDSITFFWKIFCEAIINEKLSDTNALTFVSMMHKVLKFGGDAVTIHVPDFSLSELVAKFEQDLLANGCEIYKNSGIVVVLDGKSVTINNRVILCDAVVVAVSPEHLKITINENLLRKLQHTVPISNEMSPIVNINIFMNCPLSNKVVTVFPLSPLQWVFTNKITDSLYKITISMSAASNLMSLSSSEIKDTALDAISSEYPNFDTSNIIDTYVIKYKSATFCSPVSSNYSRPSQKTSVPGLFLTGDYTDTGWASTMEGALISGKLATQEVIKAFYK